MNEKMRGLLLSVVFADLLKLSMGSSLVSVPPNVLQKQYNNIHEIYICEYQIDVFNSFFRSIFKYKFVCLFLTICQ